MANQTVGEGEHMSFGGEKTDGKQFESPVFNKILNGLKANVYVTDIETDEIIFMNETMKRDFDVTDPEGKVCWKVLQEGRGVHCEFCPVDRLRRHPNTNFVYQWDEFNAVTKRSYRNYDSLISWIDGRMVHLQQSIDVTELKSANTDELTQFYTRRYGKETLRDALKQIGEEYRTATVCLYDINLLKKVNDTFGHAVGDQLILTISDIVRDAVQEHEFVFRLSGDEFVILFLCGLREAQARMEEIRNKLSESQRKYDVSICYGLAEVAKGQAFSVDEVLFLADKRMYEQKRQFHIECNEKRLREAVEKTGSKYFEYDKERLYDALVESTDDYIYVCNMKTGIFKYTKAMVEEFGLPGEVIDNAASVWGSKVHPDDRVAFLESNQEITDGRATFHCVEYRAINRNREWVWVRCRGHLELDENGNPLLFAGFITNLGKKNKVDNLTGLFNKLEFQDQTEQMITAGQNFAIMILGIDDLKHINDLYNRFFGDEVIRIVSQRIQSLLPEGVVVYRLDGDEFGVIARDADFTFMKCLYRTIYHSFETQQIYDGKKYYCTLSGGCLFCPEDADNYENIRKYVGYCLEYSKSHGKKQCTFYSSDILSKRSKSLEMVELLRESVENDFRGFSLQYQPLVHAGNGQLFGCEALARWESAELGRISPMEFIPLLESTGLIVDVGKWILKTAITACRKWVEQKPDFVIDVNLSYVQIQNTDFFSYVRKLLKEECFSSKNLVLELTESYFVKESDRVTNIFREIRSMGVRIAMDDFGTGYSTLGILKESPADIVKVDKTFIRDIDTSSFDATFIRFVVEICHDAGIKVCLEGVETQQTCDIVSEMGIDMIQGYLFDKPLEEDVFTSKYFM